MTQIKLPPTNPGRFNEEFEKYVAEGRPSPFPDSEGMSDERYAQIVENNYERPKKLFEELVEELIKIGPDADIDDKEEIFTRAIQALDSIDTDNWESVTTNLHALIDKVAESAGLDERPSNWSVCKRDA